MMICKVIGNVWATKKEDALLGSKLMVVAQTNLFGENEAPDSFVAADMVSAGIGERVLVVSGSTARRALGGDNVPIDAAIVGIIDELEVDRTQLKDL